MDAILLLMMVCIMAICLIATVAYLLYYIGILYNVNVSVGKPPLENVWIAYKKHTGPYEKCGSHFTEIVSLCPKLDSIGIYYDDPNKVDADKLRYVVGVILCPGDEKPSESLVTLLDSRGFHTFQLPSIDYAVRARFPFIMNVSAVLGARKVYPALEAYILKNKLSAHPFIEYYSRDSIHYIVPLSKQIDFFVPEVKYKPEVDTESSKETVQDDESHNANTTDDESQGTSSSFEEIVADQVPSSDR